MNPRRYAYCLGANGPRSSWCDPLKYAEQDAERLASALVISPCNFAETKWGVATSRNSTLAELSQFMKQCQSPDLLIVHFSGHAILDEELYLLCNGTDCDDLVSSAIEIRAVKKILSRSSARYNLLILDCCHAGGAHGGAFKGKQDVQDALNQTFQGSANVILSACARYERTRELDRLDGGAGFLSWALAAACTTRFQEASQDGRSLSLANILRWLPLVLKEINHSLNEDEQIPLPEALIYTRGGDGEIWFTEPGGLTSSRIEPSEREDREHRLKAMLANHSGFIRDRLASFVGRERELAEVRQKIVEKLRTGGYVTITGQAGQGKSSVIAKLIEEYGPEKVAFHFIPFRPGPDHQVGLLRNLMARLILKYGLSDLYVASESRAALRDYFPKVLEELAERGGQEVIFIDGLDQLEEERSGRDLSFLPDNPPKGVVFVLGTRPNDTLRPLELLKPRYEYKLPDLSRADFDLILQHRGVHLGGELVDRFYEAMQKNALYLDLVAKELAETRLDNPVEVIERVADDPDKIFTLSIERLRQHERQWGSVLKPILGLLLAASEPLSIRTIRYILGVDDDEVRNGLQKLGGLISEDGHGKRYLYHLRFRDYLCQSKDKPRKEYVFASDEEEQWHKRLVAWCELNGIEQIWSDVQWELEEQERREYARKHYITHLYKARQWHRLWQVLDQGDYGRSKVRHGTSSYAQDLDLGRQAAAWEGGTFQQGIAFLPNLWRYALLRGSLTSRVDSYPGAAFELLVLLGREREALGLAELLMDPMRRIWAFLGIARRMRRVRIDLRQESSQVLLRAVQLAYDEEDIPQKFEVLRALALELVQTGQWERAQEIGQLLSARTKDYEVLRVLGLEFVRTEQWERANEASMLIGEHSERFQIKRALYLALIQNKNQYESQAEAIIQQIKSGSDWLDCLRVLNRDLLILGEWEQAERNAIGISWRTERSEILRDLGLALVQAGEWRRARMLVMSLEDWSMRFRVLRELGVEYAKAEKWKHARVMILMIEDKRERDEVLIALSMALVHAGEWQHIENLLALLEEKWLKAIVLSSLGGALYRAGEWISARKVWNECEGAIHHLEEPSRRAWAWITFGLSLAETGNRLLESRALTIWALAESTIRKIEKDSKRIRVWIELGKVLEERQHRKEAREYWMHAESELALRLHPYDPNWENLALELNQAFARSGDWERVIWLATSMRIRRQEALEYCSDLLTGLSEETRFEAIVKITISLEIGMRASWKDEMLKDLCITLARKHEWRCVDFLIGFINDTEMKVESLVALAETGQSKLAEISWSEVEAEIRRLEEDRRVEDKTVQEALSGLARSLLTAKSWERAQSVIHAIGQPRPQAEALQDLVNAMINGREWKPAEEMAKSIELRNLRAMALRNLGKALVQIHEWTHAKSIISLIELPDFKVELLRFLGVELFRVQHGDQAQEVWEEAIRIALSFEDKRKKTEMLGEQAEELIGLGQWKLVEIIFTTFGRDEWQGVVLRDLVSALDKVKEDEIPESLWVAFQQEILSLKDAQQKTELLRELSAVLILRQQWGKAIVIIRTMEQIIERSDALRILGQALVKAQQFEIAESVWVEAEQMALSISDRWQKVKALRDLGIALAQARQLEWAKEVWRKTEEALGKLDDRRQMAEALKDLGLVLADAQQLEWAREVWQKAEKNAKSLQSSRQKDEILRGLGTALVQVQQWEKVQTLIRVIKTFEVRAGLLSVLIDALIQERQWRRAETVIKAMTEGETKITLLSNLSIALTKAGQWKRAIKVVEMIDSSAQKITALQDLEVLLLQMRQWGEADAVFKTEEETIHRLQKPWERAAALHDLGVALARNQRWEKAEAVIKTIQEGEHKVKALLALGDELTNARQWKKVDQIWNQTETEVWLLNERQRVDALQILIEMLMRAQEWDRAIALLTRMEPSEKKMSLQRSLGLGLIRTQEWDRVGALIKIILSDLAHTSGIGPIQTPLAPQSDLTEILIDLQFEVPGHSTTQKINQYVLLLLELGKALADGQQGELAIVVWKEVERLIWIIGSSETRTQLLNIFVKTLNEIGEYKYLLHLVRVAWSQVNTRNNAVDLLPLGYGLVPLFPEIGSAFCEAFIWVDTFLKDQ